MLIFFLLLIHVTFAAASLRVQAFKKALIIKRSLPDSLVAEQRLPQVLLIGVRKSGTRALLEFLNLHPLIAAASDEVHFFDNDTLFEQGLDYYRKAMPFTYGNQLTIEKTPAYFSRPYVPGRVKQLFGLNIKLLVVFRDPVSRTISDYTQVLSNRRLRNVAFRKKRSIPDLHDPEVNDRYKAVNISTYVYHMNNWLEHFPLDKFHFVDGDRLVKNPIAELRDVEAFLGLPHAIGSDLLYFNKSRGFYCMKVPLSPNEDDVDSIPADAVISSSSDSPLPFKNKCLRPDKGRQHPNIALPFVKQLRHYFRPLNELLFQTIHKRFNNWQ